MTCKDDAAPFEAPPFRESLCDCGAARPLAVSISEFCRLVSLGRTTAFALAREGQIEVRRVGGRTLVLTRSIDRLLNLSKVGE